ncbi:MAG: hypothetical protein Q7J85_10530 [Bacillota bacterium]|nr:hypothetical protein [Bacillota bacterium]
MEVRPASLVVKEDARGYLYPEDTAPVVLELEQGRVVRARKTYGGWIMAEITVYDIPGPFCAWFPPGVLAEPGPTAEPREGIVEKGKTVYNVWEFSRINVERGQVYAHDMAVITGERRDGMVQIHAAAGWNGWVRENDLILDPWVNQPLPEL